MDGERIEETFLVIMRKLAEQKQKRSELGLAVETSATPETMRGEARELFRRVSYRLSRRLQNRTGR